MWESLLTGITGLLVGVGGVLVAWRRSGTEAEVAKSPAEMASQAFDAQTGLLAQLSTEVSALRTEVAMLTAENTRLRADVYRLRLELMAAKNGIALDLEEDDETGNP